MVLLGLIGGLLLIGLIVFPQFWVKQVMQKNSAPREDFPGTGGELAEHLIEHFGIEGATVEAIEHGSPMGDHYDPDTRTVRLSKANHEGNSLTAVAVAAHEIGHALQHHDGLSGRRDGGLGRRQKLAKLAMVTDKFASVFFLAAPLLTIVARTPAAFIGLGLVGVGLLCIRIIVHLVTLPVEYDASFNRALPLLKEGGYLSQEDLPAARSVLKAAALTYVAGAIMGLVDLARWIRILR